ncbi:Tn3 family transposase [Streptomyces sp. NPDC056441]|uniref:Tn3 family transposase n=1 Tax=Streptomyces sp. NPDC056441 TaxID=3345817 RepID=UPI00368DB6EA
MKPTHRTLSSSDGQRFPVKGKSTTARAMKKYFAGHGLSTYTHVSDQHTTFGTKVIVVTRREAHYVLDEIMGNKTDLPITEHATDTHGVTLVNFALFDLVGMQLSPRIRDLGKITLYRMDPQRDVNSSWPVAGPLLTQKINMGLIEENWDDLLRLAGSIKFGHATASLIVGKLSASSRQNTLAAALKEYGALRRTLYAARYLTDETCRRKIARQLNKGESLHSLRRSLLYAHEGAIRHRHLAAQTEQAWCLTLLTNSVVTWTTEYYGLAIAQMRAEGRAVDDELLAHISPAHSENVNFFGTIKWKSTPSSPSSTRPATGHCGPAARKGLTPSSGDVCRPRGKVTETGSRGYAFLLLLSSEASREAVGCRGWTGRGERVARMEDHGHGGCGGRCRVDTVALAAGQP